MKGKGCRLGGGGVWVRRRGRVCPAGSHQLKCVTVSDDTVISDVIVATGAHSRHRSPNERAGVMTGFRGAPLPPPQQPQQQPPATAPAAPSIISPRVFFRSSEISLMAKSV